MLRRSCSWARKVVGFSVSTWFTPSFSFRYSTKRRRKATKCSALLMFPGTCHPKQHKLSAQLHMHPTAFLISAADTISYYVTIY